MPKRPRLNRLNRLHAKLSAKRANENEAVRQPAALDQVGRLKTAFKFTRVFQIVASDNLQGSLFLWDLQLIFPATVLSHSAPVDHFLPVDISQITPLPNHLHAPSPQIP